MAYFVRVLSSSTACVPLQDLRRTLHEGDLDADLAVEDGTPDDWARLALSHPDGTPIAAVERSVVEDESLGTEELREFEEEIADAEPASAVRWLLDYFPHVRCVVAFRVLRGADEEDGWEILDAVKERLWRAAPGILQADGEGFTNEKGDSVLWQFESSAKGGWWMAVLEDGAWRRFHMDLGNREQRRAFKAGRVPDGLGSL